MHQALEIVLYRKNNKSRTQSYSVHSANKTNWVPNIKKKNPKVLEKKNKTSVPSQLFKQNNYGF